MEILFLSECGSNDGYKVQLKNADNWVLDGRILGVRNKNRIDPAR